MRKNMDGRCCLEIGCGGGQWSKYIYELRIFDKIICIDALSEQHNNFWENVGHDKNDKIIYNKVDDFSLSCVPDNSLDYVFSYDVFCHISYSGQKEYLKNLYRKCKPGCKLFIMYADPEKYLRSEPENRYHVVRYLPNKNKKYISDNDLISAALNDKDGEHQIGRWYWLGINNFINLCKSFNYKILSKDLNIDNTNPITLFTV